MNREEFGEQVEAAAQSMIAALQTLPPARAAEPLAEGKWSLRELAAHFLFWDTIVIRALEARMQGAEFDWSEYSDWDKLNTESTERMRSVPLARVATQWRITHETMMEALRRVPDEMLLENGEIPRWLIETVNDHYAYHAAQVERWMEKVRKEEGGRGGGELPVRNS
ncbi:maleylpyruvate isomerase N-terminal domain-containing protein [bacterium]|nr:maleylpyruvate isomerase N-terminal domain-containing protein [bacterium]MBU1983652.1 maleylpyruvate isomerase N-terminal domain-containing protein [bacterium]